MILNTVNQIIAAGVIADEKQKRVIKWYSSISNMFDEKTISNYKDDFSSSLISNDYTKKIEDIAAFHKVVLPKIPRIVDYGIAEELYSRNRLSRTKITALKRIYNF
tara:strand:+ start:211 stop:528 length:318 start_codon:yes stop_codon:yes gene_type:complete